MVYLSKASHSGCCPTHAIEADNAAETWQLVRSPRRLTVWPGRWRVVHWQDTMAEIVRFPRCYGHRADATKPPAELPSEATCICFIWFGDLIAGARNQRSHHSTV